MKGWGIEALWAHAGGAARICYLCLTNVSRSQPIFNWTQAVRLIAKAYLNPCKSVFRKSEGIGNGLTESTNPRMPFAFINVTSTPNWIISSTKPKQPHFYSLHTFLTMSLSLYRTKELGSGSRPSHSAAQYADHSFIALLALAQRLKIPFLPITWQALRDNLGQGGQARVSQALANVQTSFAFKRFRDDSTGNVDEDTPFQAVINEMVMLSHHAIQDHPYVVTLEGICWDIPRDDQIWPVLVFEKSIYGDLFQFVKAGLGSALPTQEKLKLCADIGIAIRDMHLNSMWFFLYIEVDRSQRTNYVIDIIHGDIKHENILIFKDKDHGFIAKVADFGFSTGFQGENDKIFLPKSRPWHAPEYHDRHFSPEEAKRTDIYSFGLVCFWLLFGTSGQLPFAPWMQYENAESISFEVNYEHPSILECLKKNEDDDLLKWIAWVINCQDDFNDGERKNLKQFFRFTLVRKPDQRNMNYNDLLSSLAPHRQDLKIHSYYLLLIIFRAIQPPLEQIKTDLLLAEEHFEVLKSLLLFKIVPNQLRSDRHSENFITRIFDFAPILQRVCF